MEDFDNAWGEDHFKSLVLDPSSIVDETQVPEKELGEPYVALTVQGVPYFLDVDRNKAQRGPFGSVAYKQTKVIESLRFIPYALRDNRGGKGHMRLGIRRKH